MLVTYLSWWRHQLDPRGQCRVIKTSKSFTDVCHQHWYRLTDNNWSKPNELFTAAAVFINFLCTASFLRKFVFIGFRLPVLVSDFRFNWAIELFINFTFDQVSGEIELPVKWNIFDSWNNSWTMNGMICNTAKMLAANKAFWWFEYNVLSPWIALTFCL